MHEYVPINNFRDLFIIKLTDEDVEENGGNKVCTIMYGINKIIVFLL